VSDRPVVSPRAVRALFLERQHLVRPRARSLTPLRLTRFAEDVGGLQLDSINVLERAHYLTAWSRFGPYDRARLDRLIYRRRLLFEYWAHAACLVPASALPWWRRAMLDYQGRHTGWSKWLKRNTRLIGEVTEAIRSNGPMSHGDFERGVRRKGRGGWWSWKPVQHALHHLWMTGVVAIHGRQHFRSYDLLEQALQARSPMRSPPTSFAAGTWSARSTRWAPPPSRISPATSPSRGSSRARGAPGFAPCWIRAR
jgi:uncharacterized protein YcaQ